MATPTPEAKKRGAGGWMFTCRALLFLRAHLVEETFSSSGGRENIRTSAVAASCANA